MCNGSIFSTAGPSWRYDSLALLTQPGPPPPYDGQFGAIWQLAIVSSYSSYIIIIGIIVIIIIIIVIIIIIISISISISIITIIIIVILIIYSHVKI